MLVYAVTLENGETVMVYSSKELAESQVPLIEEKYKKNTGKDVKVKAITTLKLDSRVDFAGLPDDHF